MLYNDSYNASVFVELFKDKIKWCRDLGGWFVFNGRYWECDRNGFIKDYAIKVYDKLQDDLRSYPVNNETDQKNLELFARHVKATGNNSKLDALLELAKPYLGELPENFDINPDLFNCNNKTIDLRARKAQDFNQNDMITKASKVDFLGTSECPTWNKFIDDIFMGNEELIDFIQRACGYSMTTSTKEQCIFILHGEGRNGKTVFIEILRLLFGPYASNCHTSTLIRKPNDTSIPNDIAALKGKRLVTATETNENITLDEQIIKSLTGTDSVRARFLNKEFFDFHPTFKIFMATNHKPNIRGTDKGIWRRIRLIPFKFQVTEENDDKDLADKLKAELPGILKWVLEGYKKWADFGLTFPDIVKQATHGYQTEEDDVGQFIEDYCDIGEGETVAVSVFKERFKTCMGYHKSQKTISEYMSRRGFKQIRKVIEGSQIRCWEGLRILSTWET